MRRKHIFMLLIAALILVYTGVLCAADQRPSVAVLDFESMGTEEHIGKAVSEIMRTALVSNQSYRVVERAQINKALSEQNFQKSGVIDDKSAVALGKLLGADLIVVGSVVKIGNAYTINSRMIDVKTGEAKRGKNVTGTDLNLLTSMSNELVDNLFAQDGREPPPGSQNEGKKTVGSTVMKKTSAGTAVDSDGRTLTGKAAKKQGASEYRGTSKDYMNLNYWEILDGQWQIRNGSLVGSGGHIIMKEEFQDYVFEVTVEHLSGPKSGVGIGTRCTVVPGGQKTFRNNTSINQGYTFNFDFNKNYNIYSGLAGNWYPMNPNWRRYDWQFAAPFHDHVNRIRIEAAGINIKIFVNETFLVEYSDSSHTMGAPLLWVQSPAERVKFSNIRIIQPEFGPR